MIENFARNVARLRKEQEMTQEELAEKIGVRKQSISSIERGGRYPTFENLEKISQVLNASAIQLFGTANEIAVSDIPIILDRIDEYSGKVQAVLKVEKMLKDGFVLKKLDEIVGATQILSMKK